MLNSHDRVYDRRVPLDDAELEKKLAPLLRAIGRMVLAVASLEKLLLGYIAQDAAMSSEDHSEIAKRITELEKRPAGILVSELSKLNLHRAVSARLADVVTRRNDVVHHFMETPDAALALQSGDHLEPLLARIDGVTNDCANLIGELYPEALRGMNLLAGGSLADLVDEIRDIDPAMIDDEQMRAAAVYARSIDASSLRALEAPDRSETS